MEFHEYARPNVTTDVVLFRVRKEKSKNSRKNDKAVLEVMLVCRDSEPDKGKWSLPGGFVNIDEDIHNNMRRKLEEKAGITGSFYDEQLYTWGDLDRDSRGRIISVSYLAICNSETYSESKTDMEKGWFSVNDILNDSVDLAFDHKKIIKYALNRIVNKVEYTDIAFNFLQKEFTMSECQAVYEEILGRSIMNFRRKVSDYVKPLDKMADNTGRQFRPAKLYKCKKLKSKF